MPPMPSAARARAPPSPSAAATAAASANARRDRASWPARRFASAASTSAVARPVAPARNVLAMAAITAHPGAARKGPPRPADGTGAPAGRHRPASEAGDDAGVRLLVPPVLVGLVVLRLGGAGGGRGVAHLGDQA